MSEVLTCYLVFNILTAAFGSAFQTGWSVGLYNTPVEVIKEFFYTTYRDRYGTEMPDTQFDILWSITNGLLLLGGAFGSLGTSSLADRFGRKTGILLTNVFVIVSVIMNVISKFVKSYELLIASRFVNGIYYGLFLGLCGVYLNELPPIKYRGVFGMFTQMFIFVGMITTNVLGLPQVFGTINRWPILVGFPLVPMFVSLLLLFGVESPKYFYIRKDKAEEAERVLFKLRGNANVDLVREELNKLEDEKNSIKNQNTIGWLDLVRKPVLRHALLISIGIMAFQQFSGINFIWFYSTKIFQEVGLKGLLPQLATILLSVVQLMTTIASMFLIERVGRKILLITSFTGMSFFSFLIVTFRVLQEVTGRSVFNYLLIGVVVAFLISFSIAPGAWIINHELFTSDARAKATGISTSLGRISALIATVCFPFLERGVGNYSFIVCGVFNIIFGLCILFLVPETKSKTSDQIQLDLASRKIFFIEKKHNIIET